MKNNFDSHLPIYLQMMDEIKKNIFNKTYLPGKKIPSVRELALQYSINPNTIQKSLIELEREGFLRSERAVGRFVTEDQNLINQLRKQHAQSKIKDFIQEIYAFGYDDHDILSTLKEELHDQGGS